MYDIKPDRIGWTVYDVELGRPFLWDELALIGLEHEAADELASLLNRTVYRLPRTSVPRVPGGGTAVPRSPAGTSSRAKFSLGRAGHG